MKMGGIEVPESKIEQFGMVELQEFCDVKAHEKINFWLYKDEVICPRCESEKREKQRLRKISTDHYMSSKEGRRMFLYSHSIVHDKKILTKGIRDFINKDESESQIKRKANQIVMDVSSDKRNVFMVGPAGTGKTHLSLGILKNINELSTSMRCLFVSLPKLLELIRKSFNYQNEPKNEDYYLGLLDEADVLVLDDIAGDLSMLNNKSASDFSSRILYSILNARSEKSTIFTSNLTIPQLKEIYDERIISRIQTKIIELDFNKISDKRKIASKLQNESRKING